MVEAWDPDHLHILPFIAALTTYVQTKMMQKTQQNNPQMQMMNSIMLVFPILILVMAWSFPSALPLYWIFTNIYTIVQNYFLYVRNADKKDEGKAALSAKSK